MKTWIRQSLYLNLVLFSALYSHEKAHVVNRAALRHIILTHGSTWLWVLGTHFWWSFLIPWYRRWVNQICLYCILHMFSVSRLHRNCNVFGCHSGCWSDTKTNASRISLGSGISQTAFGICNTKLRSINIVAHLCINLHHYPWIVELFAIDLFQSWSGGNWTPNEKKMWR